MKSDCFLDQEGQKKLLVRNSILYATLYGLLWFPAMWLSERWLDLGFSRGIYHPSGMIHASIAVLFSHLMLRILLVPCMRFHFYARFFKGCSSVDSQKPSCQLQCKSFYSRWLVQQPKRIINSCCRAYFGRCPNPQKKLAAKAFFFGLLSLTLGLCMLHWWQTAVAVPILTKSFVTLMAWFAVRMTGLTLLKWSIVRKKMEKCKLIQQNDCANMPVKEDNLASNTPQQEPACGSAKEGGKPWPCLCDRVEPAGFKSLVEGRGWGLLCGFLHLVFWGYAFFYGCRHFRADPDPSPISALLAFALGWIALQQALYQAQYRFIYLPLQAMLTFCKMKQNSDSGAAEDLSSSATPKPSASASESASTPQPLPSESSTTPSRPHTPPFPR